MIISSSRLGAGETCILTSFVFRLLRLQIGERSDDLLFHWEKAIHGPSRPSVHGLLPRPDLIDFLNNRRQESVSFVSTVHLSSPSRLRRPTLTNFCNNRHQEFVPFVSEVHPGGPSRPSVHGPHPRPALTDFWNNRRQESMLFVSKVHPSSPSRLAVHGPLWQTSETIGVRNPCRLFQKFTQLPVRASRPRPALTDFWNNRREESVPFDSKVHPGGPSRTSVTARSPELLKQTAPHTADCGLVFPIVI